VAAFKHQIALNVIPHIDAFLDNGYTKEEMKMTNEGRKILGIRPARHLHHRARARADAHSISINAQSRRRSRGRRRGN